MKSIPFLIFLLSFVTITTAHAQDITISLSDLNLQKGIKILVYDYQGKFVGEFNSTDTIMLNSSNATSYIFVLKPSEQSWFSDPLYALELLKASAPTILSYLLFGGVIFALVYLIASLRR